MRVWGLVVLLAVASCVRAHCGCLKCSKHLTVAGQTIPIGPCGPAKIIFRGPPATSEDQALPVSVQVPIPLGGGSTTSSVRGDLSYGVVGGNPIITTSPIVSTGPVYPGGGTVLSAGGTVVGGTALGGTVVGGTVVGGTVLGGPIINIPRTYDSRIEAPIPAPPKPNGGSISIPLPIPPEKLSACVDRVVIPSPSIDYASGAYKVITAGGASVVVPGGVGPVGGSVYGNPGPYVGPGIIGPRPSCSGLSLGPGPVILPGSGQIVSGGISGIGTVGPVGTIGTIGTVGTVGTVGAIGGSGVLVNPIRGGLSYSCSRNTVVPSGPVLDALNSRQVRYSPHAKVDNSSRCDKLGLGSNTTNYQVKVNSRSKRNIPFIKHGYNFFMNMLPDFVQQPIKNTVNEFAMTHPDRKLQRMYNQPPELSLKEKLQWQSRKNIAALKQRLLDRRQNKENARSHVAGTPRHFLDEEPLKYQYPKSPTMHSRFANVDQNLSEGDKEDIEISTDRILEIVKKTLEAKEFQIDPRLSEKYPHLSEESLDDRASIEAKSSEADKISQMTDLQQLLLLKKLKKYNEANKRSKRSTYFQRKKYMSEPSKSSSVLLDSDQFVLPFYQVKDRDSTNRYSRGTDQNNKDLRDEILRAVIRKELKNFKTEREKEVLKDPFNYQNMVPHSPLYHLINFPLTLVKTFSDIGSQALPMLGSIPKVMTDSNKYFRNFGKNFRRNMLHLFSNVIGDFDNLPQTNTFGPKRYRRDVEGNNFGKDLSKERKLEQYEPEYSLVGRKMEQYEPEYSLVFGEGQNFRNSSEAKVRKKRYLLKMVDEGEVEDFLMEKLGGLFGQSDNPTLQMSRNAPQFQMDPNCPYCSFYSTTFETPEVENGQKMVIEQVRPKLILDNNGLPFLEINGYKKPMFLGNRKRKSSKRRKQRPIDDFSQYDSSEEANGDKISYLIDHARNNLEERLTQRHDEMPIRTIKEKISRQLFDTDMLVHMDFDKYHDIYDDLFTLQHIKTSTVQDWKRLLMSKRINDMNAKISLLGKFQEMQRYKDDVLTKISQALNEDCDNRFATKNLVKMLVRLQKLQCVINDVVGNFQEKLRLNSNFDTAKEIKYVEFLGSLNFVNSKTRNDMIDNLKKSRDVALQQNIMTLDKLKKLLMYEHDHDKISEQASLLWEMGNIEKMQLSTIEEMNQRLGDGQKIKKELKILFDLLKRQEACEEEQNKLLSKFEGSNEDESSEEEDRLGARRALTKKKFDINEFRAKWQERLKQRKMLLRRKLRKNMRNRKVSSESDEDE